MADYLRQGDKPQNDYHGFQVRFYDTFCRNLRRLAAGWIKQRKLLPAAIVLALTAAIEANLLHFSLQTGSFISETADYLRKFVERKDYE